MTFVAQPYEQFADDLLTALTGGMIREEHQFVGAEERYSLASPDAIPRTVKVVGQRNDAVTVFEGGIDYDYQPDDGVIVWKSDGGLPDNHAFFYVNYYVQETRRRLTDRNPGSVTATLAEAFAREFAVLHKQMEMIYRSAFVDSATGASLDHVAALLALERKDAKFAGGEALFKRSTPADGDITIPAGTLISTNEGQNFETSDKRTLRKGQLAIVAPIRAQAEGELGRVAAGLIKNINRPIFGIESVTNEGPTFFATEKETDEELRRRIKGTLERAGKSTSNALKFSLIEEIPGINEGNVQVTEDAEIPGKVEVKFGLGSAVAPDLVRRIEETIFYSRAAGVRVTHNLPTRTITARGKDTTRAEVIEHFNRRRESIELVHLDQVALAQMPEGILDLQIEILLRLTEPNLSVSQKENIEDEVRAAAVAYVESLPMGADLIYSKMLGRVVESEKVRDAFILIRPIGATNQVFKQNLATDGRKASVQLQQVFVGLMEESIFVSVLVQLEIRPSPSNGSEPQPADTGGPKVSQALQTAVTSAIKKILDTAGSSLTKTALRDAIKAAIENDGKSLQLTQNNPVVLNAEYEQSGQLLLDTDQVAVAENQIFELRKVDIKIPGALDG